jgi:hypothetical protein
VIGWRRLNIDLVDGDRERGVAFPGKVLESDKPDVTDQGRSNLDDHPVGVPRANDTCGLIAGSEDR